MGLDNLPYDAEAQTGPRLPMLRSGRIAASEAVEHSRLTRERDTRAAILNSQGNLDGAVLTLPRLDETRTSPPRWL